MAGRLPVWEVVAGTEGGGVLVREGPGPDAVPLQERLPVGVFVGELEEQDGRIRFQRLTGQGPDSGWVGLRLSSGQALLARVWEVLGGSDKGGIVVRQGRSTSSTQLEERLATGATLRELELHGERLHFRKLEGTGPASGWASVRISSGAVLLARKDSEPPAPVPKPYDPYALLGIRSDATDAEIKSAFRKASIRVHPDRNPDDPNAAESFRELTGAKDFLLDPFRRRLYNLQHGLLVTTWNVIWWSDWDEIFGELDAALADEEVAHDAQPSPEAPLAEARTDLVIMGATGMTGSLACMVMCRGCTGVTWGIAGRDGRKLQKLREKFGGGRQFRGSTRVETPDDLARLARSARVVVDFTGPKTEVGIGMAEACVRMGTHYVEVTGEPSVSKQLQRLDEPAREAGVCIVVGAGYASLPSDFGTWYAVKHLRDKHGLPTRRVDSYSQTQGSTMSGTTVMTWMKRDHAKYSQLIKDGGGPFFLGGVRPGGVRPEDEDDSEPWQDIYTGGWATTHSTMDNINVRATCGLMDAYQPYGDQFLFKSWNLHSEKPYWVPPEHRPPVKKDRGIRDYELRVKRQEIQPPGSGPRERLRQETFVTLIFAATADEPGDAPHQAHCILNAGPGGVGDRYEGSATLCVEAGACLIAAEEAGGGEGGRAGGLLRPGWGTPVYHLAHMGFLERLVARGFRFKIVEGPPKSEFIVSVLMSTMPLAS